MEENGSHLNIYIYYTLQPVNETKMMKKVKSRQNSNSELSAKLKSEVFSSIFISVTFKFCSLMHILQQGNTNPRCQVNTATKFLQKCLMFVCPHYGTSFLSPFWHLQFQGVS